MNQNKNDKGESVKRKKWIFLNYKLPADTSEIRANICRELINLGAVNIQKSMWIMPNNLENCFLLQNVSRHIESNNGESFLMKSEFFEESHEKRIISIFNKIQDERYQDFIGNCCKYIKTIETKNSAEKFAFPEMEEEEEKYEKLVSELQKIKSRDLDYSCLQEEALRMIEKSKDAYKKYSEMVYQKNVFG